MSVRAANSSALRAIPTSGFDPDVVQSVFVTTHGDYFYSVRGTSLTPAAGTIYNSNDGLYQWCRMGIPNQAYLAARFWAIDESVGSDENLGYGATQAAADLVPLKTLGELNRRVVGSSYDFTVVFHILSDITAANYCALTNVRAKNANGYPILRGKKTAINSSPIAVTGYATHVPASNTGYLVTAAGVGSWTPYLGALIENADGTKVGFVQSASGTTARCTGGINVSTDLTSSVTANAWANSDQLTAYTLSRIPAIPLGGDGLQYIGVEYLKFGFGYSSALLFSSFGTATPYFDRCIVEAGMALGGALGNFSACAFIGAGFVRNFTGYMSACAVRGTFELGDCGVTLNDLSGIPALDIEAGAVNLENVVLAGTSNASLAVFNCTASAIKDTSGTKGIGAVRLTLQGASKVYGSGNSSYILNLPVGHHSVTASGLTATTSLAHPLRLAGVDKDYADVPVADATNGAWLLNK